MTRPLVVLALACAACGGIGRGGLRVEVGAEGGGALGELRAVLASQAGPIVAVTCPGDAPVGPLRCVAGGLAIDASAVPADLTLKAPGHAFPTLALVAADVERGYLRVVLPALAPFARTETHATGFGLGDESVAFGELAVAVRDELGPSASLKFYIEGLDTQPRVYFQNTRLYPRHIDFVSYGLGLPISPAEFERRTYHGSERTALAGTLIARPEIVLPAGPARPEVRAPVTLEFFPSDDLTPALALVAHRLLEERLLFLARGGAAKRLVYVPAADRQERELAADTRVFLARAALYARHTDLYAGVTQQILNPGLAYGTLRRLTPQELARGVVSRRDIVLLTRLPNDLPLVAGTITEELQTPLAHVNLAARARGTPNLALPGASDDPRVAPLLGTLVRFEVTADSFTLAPATLAEAEAFWAGQVPASLLPESDASFAGLPGFEEIGFADAVRVGVKAANLAELRALLGEQAPAGFAVPFSAFDRYMSENRVLAERCELARAACEGAGRPSQRCGAADELCQAGAEAGDTYYGYLERLLAAPDFVTSTELREACLAGLRFLVESGDVAPDFAAALDARVLEVFGPEQVRLRSSTNVEDLAEFTGAGLYESVSAEGDAERRPSRRIRLVWASTWNFPAFEERSFWNVVERAVRMGVAVNLARDDEVANGVLITANLSQPGAPGYHVNAQIGEHSVANPEGGMTPEVLTIVTDPEGRPTAVRHSYSSLAPDTPVLGDADIAALADAATRVESHFAPLYGTTPSRGAFDLEWKLLGPGRALLIKQARPYSSRPAP